jgi:hypothetical protein
VIIGKSAAAHMVAHIKFSDFPGGSVQQDVENLIGAGHAAFNNGSGAQLSAIRLPGRIRSRSNDFQGCKPGVKVPQKLSSSPLMRANRSRMCAQRSIEV